MKTENLFKEWVNSLEVGIYPKVRKRVINECYITDQTFRHWKAGTVKIPALAQEKINEIAGYEVFNLENERKQ